MQTWHKLTHLVKLLLEEMEIPLLILKAQHKLAISVREIAYHNIKVNRTVLIPI